MSEPISINRFVKGVNTDIAEDTLPEGFLSGGHNIKLSNHDNKQGIVQKQEGYIKKLNGYGINLKPLAAKVFNNIIYIVSYNISTGQTEYGTYPSADLGTRNGSSGKEMTQKVYTYAPLPNFKVESLATANPANIYYVDNLNTPIETSVITVNDGSNWEWVSDSGDFDTVTPYGGASGSTISMHHPDNYTNESIKREVVVKSVNGTIPTTITVIQKWGAWIKANPNIFNNILAVNPADVYTEVTTSLGGAPAVVQSKSAELTFLDFDPSTKIMTVGIDNNSGSPRQLNMVLATSGDEIKTTTILFNQLEDTIETDTVSVTVTAAGGSSIALCTVTATSAWTASINHASVTGVNPSTGNTGNTVVTVNIGTGTAGGVTGNITFVSDGSGKTAFTSIIQQADFMTLAPDQVTIPALGGNTFATQAQSAISWSTIIGQPSNMTLISPATGTSSPTNVWITATTNNTSSDITSDVTFISGTGVSNILIVIQEKAPAISFSPSSVSIGEYAQTGVVVGTLISEDNWSLGAIPNWITPSQTSGAATAGLQITCDVTANTDNINARTGVLNFNLVDFTGSASGSVIQAVSTENIDFTPTILTVGPIGDLIFDLGNLTTTSSWTITSTNSWLTNFSAISGGVESGTLITARHSENTGLTSRNEDVDFELDSNGAVATVTVSQDPYSVSIFTLNSTIAWNETAFTIDVLSNGSWTIDTNNLDPLLSIPVGDLTGNGDKTGIIVTVASQNTSTVARQMDVYVEINSNTAINYTRTLTQSGQ